MNSKNRFILSAMILILLSIFIGCSNQNKPNLDGEKVRDYANALYNRELYPQAVREYQRYLDLYDVNVQQRANINFIIGNVHFDRLHNYEDAMSYYLKVKHVFPESDLMPNVNKRIVACLERLQRSADAKQALDEATSMDPQTPITSRPGTVLAKIGEREITSGDLKHHIGQLPDYLQSQFTDRKVKIEFLRQLVATELFYDAAKRGGLDKNSEVIDGAFQAKKSLMVNKYLQNEIAGQIQISPDDVELYFKAHQDQYVEKDDKGNVKRQKTFSETQQQVAEDLARERQQKAYNELLQRMMTAENVKIYDDLVK